MKEYILKFTQLSKYAPTIVVDSRANMNKFVRAISHFVVNECRSVMLLIIIKISRIMVHAEQIEEKKLNQVAKKLNRTRPDDENSCKTRLKGER